MKEINVVELKKVVKMLNDSGLLEKVSLKTIRIVGVKAQDILNAFGDAVDAIYDANPQEALHADIIKFYNESFDEEDAGEEDAGEEDAGEEDAGEEGDSTNTAEPASEKKEKPVKKEKPKKEKVTGPAGKEKKERAKNLISTKPRSCYGHIASAKSGQLDEMLKAGATYNKLMTTCEVKLHRVKGHIKVLKDKGLTLLEKKDEKEPLNTHVQIKEESI